MKRFALVALLVSLFVAGCGGASNPNTPPNEPNVPSDHPINRVPPAATAPINSIEGKVPNWDGGSAYAVLVVPQGVDGVFAAASAPISSDGSFSLALPAAVDDVLLDDFQGQCWSTVPDIASAELMVSAIPNPSSKADLLGHLWLQGRLENETIKPFVSWTYAQSTGTFQGSCEYERTEGQPNEIWKLDFRLVQGWNVTVHTEVEGDPEFELYQTKPIPAGVEWIYHPLEPGAP